MKELLLGKEWWDLCVYFLLYQIGSHLVPYAAMIPDMITTFITPYFVQRFYIDNDGGGAGERPNRMRLV